MADVGVRVVDYLFEQMMVDAEWSVRQERAFTWWGADLAQRIWAERCFEDQGFWISRVHIRTDLLRKFERTKEAERKLAAAGAVATIAGVVVDKDDPTLLQVASSMCVHDETEEAFRRLLLGVAGVQVVEAHIMAPIYAQLCDAEVAVSAHPQSGQREEADDLLNVIEAVIAPVGKEPSRWTGDEFGTLAKQLQGPPCVLATADETGLAAEFPFGESTSLVQIDAAANHPRLGNGCLFTFKYPPEASVDSLAYLALELNSGEVAVRTNFHFLGSWCVHNQSLAFVSFLPNAFHRPNAVINLATSLLVRVRWATEKVFEMSLEDNFERALKRKTELFQNLGGHGG
jgi:hypothetical protein